MWQCFLPFPSHVLSSAGTGDSQFLQMVHEHLQANVISQDGRSCFLKFNEKGLLAGLLEAGWNSGVIKDPSPHKISKCCPSAKSTPATQPRPLPS